MGHITIVTGLRDSTRAELAEMLEKGTREDYILANYLNNAANCTENGQTPDELVRAALDNFREAVQRMDGFRESAQRMAEATPVATIKPREHITAHPSADDPYNALIQAAISAADELDAIRAITRHSAEANTVALRIVIGDLQQHLQNNVSNRGGSIELHKFSARAMPAEEIPYMDWAINNLARAGELEFDDPTVVSISDDNGAYVLGWAWVADDDIEPADDENEDTDASE